MISRAIVAAGLLTGTVVLMAASGPHLSNLLHPAPAVSHEIVPMPPEGCEQSVTCRTDWLHRYCVELPPEGKLSARLSCPGAPKGWRYRIWQFEY